MKHKALGLLLLLSVFVQPLSADSESAVLIMAPGGSSAWMKTVKKAVKAADLPYPYKIFFGVGDTPGTAARAAEYGGRFGKRRRPFHLCRAAFNFVLF